MKINMINVYNDRIVEINKQMKIVSKGKRWKDYYTLKHEKEYLKNKIEEIMHKEKNIGR